MTTINSFLFPLKGVGAVQPLRAVRVIDLPPPCAGPAEAT